MITNMHPSSNLRMFTFNVISYPSYVLSKTISKKNNDSWMQLITCNNSNLRLSILELKDVKDWNISVVLYRLLQNVNYILGKYQKVHMLIKVCNLNNMSTAWFTAVYVCKVLQTRGIVNAISRKLYNETRE